MHLKTQGPRWWRDQSDCENSRLNPASGLRVTFGGSSSCSQGLLLLRQVQSPNHVGQSGLEQLDLVLLHLDSLLQRGDAVGHLHAAGCRRAVIWGEARIRRVRSGSRYWFLCMFASSVCSLILCNRLLICLHLTHKYTIFDHQGPLHYWKHTHTHTLRWGSPQFGLWSPKFDEIFM